MARLRVQFIHGLEGSPQGTKARLLSRHFDTLTPAMDTSDFEACVAVQADALAVWLVHGLRDELIDIEDSRRLAASGSPEWVVLHEVDDDHPLHETVATGRLVELVRELAESASRERQESAR